MKRKRRHFGAKFKTKVVLEEEVRSILKTALARESSSSDNLAESIRKRFEPLVGINLPEVSREPI